MQEVNQYSNLTTSFKIEVKNVIIFIKIDFRTYFYTNLLNSATPLQQKNAQTEVSANINNILINFTKTREHPPLLGYFHYY